MNSKPFLQLGTLIIAISQIIAVMFDVKDGTGNDAVRLVQCSTMAPVLYFKDNSSEAAKLRFWASQQGTSGWLRIGAVSSVFAIAHIKGIDLSSGGEGVALTLSNGFPVYYDHGTKEAEALIEALRPLTI